MDLKTYQAYTMAEALAAVKRDLGADAVILSTRTSHRGGVMGIGRRTVIEVTAARRESTGEELRASKPRATPARTAGATVPGRTAARAYAQPAASGAAAADDSRLPTERKLEILKDGPSNPEFDRLRTRRLAQAMLEQHERRARDASAETVDAAGAGVAVTATASQEASVAPGPATGRPDRARDLATTDGDRLVLTSATGVEARPDGVKVNNRVARRFLARRAAASSQVPAAPATSESDVAGPAPATPAIPATPVTPALPEAPEPNGAAPMPVAIFETPHTVTPPPAEASGRSETDVMRDELAAIRTMVGHVLQRQTKDAARPDALVPTMAEPLFDEYLALVGQDLSSDLAGRIVHEVQADLDPSALQDAATVRRAVRHRLASYIPSAAQPVPESSPDGRPLTLALVGPTGVGKTTTLAKLAASFKLRHNRSVGLITCDTYRIAAVDQLRTYANIIGLPLEVVLTPADMRQAVQSLSHCDVLLIDTAGRSQNDADRISDLRDYLAAAEPHEVHMVLSATASERVLMHEAEAFGTVGVRKVVLTKLDEAVSFGVLVEVVRRIGKELSFFTTGQEVPDHIEIGQAERLADLVLGADVRETVTA